ncbi:hypothetical protein RF55_13075 [Lasius niger]|uniref:Uncharacterized protein n=1 Tax=Lasius niger TaxID=67767 RepID=A0A0J7N4M6_LASNI|nr:hypothetical protein RF55_13075 [Lasius niger]
METNNVPLQEELTFPIEMDNDDCDNDLIATAFEEITRYSKQNYSNNLVMNMTDNNNFNSPGTYEGNAIAYFAGYIAHNGYENTKCDNCRETNMKTPVEGSNDNEIYIQLIEYEHKNEDGPEIEWLSRPTDTFLNIVAL